MEFRVVLEEKYGTEVWTHPDMDRLRKEQCLCLNCRFMRPSHTDHCKIAAAGYALCQLTDIAFAVTRCPKFLRLLGPKDSADGR